MVNCAEKGDVQIVLYIWVRKRKTTEPSHSWFPPLFPSG